MGKFIYGAPGGYEVEIDDRALAHVKVAMFAKLRRNESFSFSWQVNVEEGSGRHSLWISPASMIHFHFYGSRPAELNRTWIRQLIIAANDGDLRLLDEPAEEPSSGSSSRGRW